MSSRSKGRRGETAAKRLLEERDYSVEDLSAGIASCDLLAIKDGHVWACEVKNRDIINLRDFRKQARANAKKGTRWMLMCKLADTSSWYIERQGLRPAVWHERGSA